jgi:3-oxoacyl-[acyl-carrier protein] reductase
MMGELDGKVALVTGAAVGLGRAFAVALARQGARLVGCDVRDEIDSLPKEVGVDTLALKADVANATDVRRVVNSAERRFGRIDVLVNNAGVWAGSLPTDDLAKSIADYDHLVGINLKGSFMFGRAVMRLMIAQRSGDIVNICTDHVQTVGRGPRPTGGGPGMDLYDAAKWAQLGLTFAWARALEPHNVRVNALCMGATDSHMLRSFHKFDPPAQEVARWMKAEDVSRLMLDLLRDGRTGDYIGIAVGHPIVLPPRRRNPYVMTDSPR